MRRISPVLLTGVVFMLVAGLVWLAWRPVVAPVETVSPVAIDGQGQNEPQLILQASAPAAPDGLNSGALGPLDAGAPGGEGLNPAAPNLRLDIQLPAVPESPKIITVPVPVLGQNEADQVAPGGLNNPAVLTVPVVITVPVMVTQFPTATAFPQGKEVLLLSADEISGAVESVYTPQPVVVTVTPVVISSTLPILD